MFKYLWLVVAVIAYAYWVSVVVREVNEEIKSCRRMKRKFNLEWCGIATEAYILVHFIVVMSWSIALFVLDLHK